MTALQVLVLLAVTWAIVSTAAKGKWGFLVAGFLVGIFWWVGACRLAKPGSFWYRTLYSAEKQRRADERHGKAEPAAA